MSKRYIQESLPPCLTEGFRTNLFRIRIMVIINPFNLDLSGECSQHSRPRRDVERGEESSREHIRNRTRDEHQATKKELSQVSSSSSSSSLSSPQIK